MYVILPKPVTISHSVGVTLGNARIIRAMMEKYYDGEYSEAHEHESHGVLRCLHDIDKVMNTHGVEACGETNEHGETDYMEAKWTAQYCNTGDTYDCTVVFLSGEHPKRWTEGFKLMCWGDLYE